MLDENIVTFSAENKYLKMPSTGTLGILNFFHEFQINNIFNTTFLKQLSHPAHSSWLSPISFKFLTKYEYFYEFKENKCTVYKLDPFLQMAQCLLFINIDLFRYH